VLNGQGRSQAALPLDGTAEVAEPAVSGPIAEFVGLVGAIRWGDFRAATRHRRALNALGFNILVRPEARERLLAADREGRLRPQGPGAPQVGWDSQTKKEDGGGSCLRTLRRLQDQASTALPPSRELTDTP
jgi:hypothetical protein